MDAENKGDLSNATRVVEDVEDDNPEEHTTYDLVDKKVAPYAGEGLVEIDEATDKRLKRLIDKRVLVVMIFTYFIQSLDRGTVSFASIMGLLSDAHLVGQQVGTPCRGWFRPRS